MIRSLAGLILLLHAGPVRDLSSGQSAHGGTSAIALEALPPERGFYPHDYDDEALTARLFRLTDAVLSERAGVSLPSLTASSFAPWTDSIDALKKVFTDFAAGSQVVHPDDAALQTEHPLLACLSGCVLIVALGDQGAMGHIWEGTYIDYLNHRPIQEILFKMSGTLAGSTLFIIPSGMKSSVESAALIEPILRDFLRTMGISVASIEMVNPFQWIPEETNERVIWSHVKLVTARRLELLFSLPYNSVTYKSPIVYGKAVYDGTWTFLPYSEHQPAHLTGLSA